MTERLNWLLGSLQPWWWDKFQLTVLSVGRYHTSNSSTWKSTNRKINFWTKHYCIFAFFKRTERTLLSQQRQTASSPLVFMIPFILSQYRILIFLLVTKRALGLSSLLSGKRICLPKQETQVWFPGTERSPGGGNGYPSQYSCLENSMDTAWWATVHGVCKELDMAEQTWKQALTHHILYMWNLKYDTNKCAEPIIDTENKHMVTKREVGRGWYNLELTTRSNCIAQGTI